MRNWTIWLLIFLEKTIPTWNPRLNSASPETVKEGHLRKGWWPPGDTPTTRWSGNGEWPLYRWISHYKVDGYWDSFIDGFTTLYRSDVNPVDIICRSLFCVSLGDQSDAIRTSGLKQSCSLKISWILGKQGCPIVQYSKILFQSFLLEFHVGVHELSCISLCERHLLWQSPQSPRRGAAILTADIASGLVGFLAGTLVHHGLSASDTGRSGSWGSMTPGPLRPICV